MRRRIKLLLKSMGVGTYTSISQASIAEVMADAKRSESDRVLLQAVNKRVSVNDDMYTGNGVHYLSVGLSAIHCIEKAMRRARIETFRNILDLPCGHGRVLRFLSLRFPEARHTACDLDHDGVDFCHKQFGARPVYSRPDFDQLSLGEQFDLIWCGSLATHLDSKATLGLLRFCHRHLAVGGLLVFSMHGMYSLEMLRDGERTYGLSPDGIAELIRSCESSGYGYADYSDMAGYGIAVASPEWISAHLPETGAWGDYHFSPQCWDNHHDVYSVVR